MGTYVSVPSDALNKNSGMSDSKAFVQDRFDMTNDYALQSFNMTMDYVDTLQAMLDGLVIPDSDDIVVDSPDITPIDYSARPKIGDVDIPNDWPEKNVNAISWLPLPSFSDISIPTLSVIPPVWNDPDIPMSSTITEPGDIPIINPVVTPTAPSLVLPVAPLFGDINIPAAPTVALPPFELERPSVTLNEPAPFLWGEPVYISDIWGDLLAKVLDGIQNGGTGLDADVEAEIYQRLLDRQQDENEQLYIEARDDFSARGFPLPPGALISRLTEIQNQISRNNSAASREITINQAELAQKNTHFILDKGIHLEGMIRDFFTQGTNRLFEANKTIADNAINIYNALITKFNADNQAYETESRVYSERIKAALTEVEIFKVQIEGAKLESDVQRNLVEVYNAQINAVEGQIKLYVSEMEGVKIASEIEMMKLEQFKLETQAYVARLDGEKAKFSIYETQVKAEGSKATTYGSQVSAYAVEVDAAKSQIDMQLSQQQIVLDQNKQEVSRYSIELDAYKADLQAMVSRVSSAVSGFQAETSAYNAETNADASMYSAIIQETQARISEAQFNLEGAIAKVDSTTKGYIAIKNLQIEGTSGIMDVGAQLSASAMNAVNASASFGFSGSRGINEGWSHGESINESHTYEEE